MGFQIVQNSLCKIVFRNLKDLASQHSLSRRKPHEDIMANERYYELFNEMIKDLQGEDIQNFIHLCSGLMPWPDGSRNKL